MKIIDSRIETGIVPQGQRQPGTWQWYAQAADGQFSFRRGYRTRFGAHLAARRWLKDLKRRFR